MSENLNKLFSPVLLVETLTAATKALDVYDTGKVFLVDASGNAVAITLPTAAAAGSGWFAKFILTATGNAATIVTSGSENVLLGHVIAIDADGSAIAVTADADADTITFVNACVAGARVDIVCDGTNFFIEGFGTHASAATKLTLTKAT